MGAGLSNSKGSVSLGRPELLGAKITWPCSEWMEMPLEVLKEEQHDLKEPCVCWGIARTIETTETRGRQDLFTEIQVEDGGWFREAVLEMRH